MLNEMFYDAFSNSYTVEPDLYAPPERYVKTVRGDHDVYVDVWAGEKKGHPNSELRLEYPPEDYYSPEHNARFFESCEKNNFKAKILSCFIVPAKVFDEYVVKFGLE